MSNSNVQRLIAMMEQKTTNNTSCQKTYGLNEKDLITSPTVRRLTLGEIKTKHTQVNSYVTIDDNNTETVQNVDQSVLLNKSSRIEIGSIHTGLNRVNKASNVMNPKPVASSSKTSTKMSSPNRMQANSANLMTASDQSLLASRKLPFSTKSWNAKKVDGSILNNPKLAVTQDRNASSRTPTDSENEVNKKSPVDDEYNTTSITSKLDNSVKTAPAKDANLESSLTATKPNTRESRIPLTAQKVKTTRKIQEKEAPKTPSRQNPKRKATLNANWRYDPIHVSMTPQQNRSQLHKGLTVNNILTKGKKRRKTIDVSVENSGMALGTILSTWAQITEIHKELHKTTPVLAQKLSSIQADQKNTAKHKAVRSTRKTEAPKKPSRVNKKSSVTATARAKTDSFTKASKTKQRSKIQNDFVDMSGGVLGALDSVSDDEHTIKETYQTTAIPDKRSTTTSISKSSRKRKRQLEESLLKCSITKKIQAPNINKKSSRKSLQPSKMKKCDVREKSNLIGRSFKLFFDDHEAKLKEKHPGMSDLQLHDMAQIEWKRLRLEERRTYQERAMNDIVNQTALSTAVIPERFDDSIVVTEDETTELVGQKKNEVSSCSVPIPDHKPVRQKHTVPTTVINDLLSDDKTMLKPVAAFPSRAAEERFDLTVSVAENPRYSDYGCPDTSETLHKQVEESTVGASIENLHSKSTINSQKTLHDNVTSKYQSNNYHSRNVSSTNAIIALENVSSLKARSEIDARVKLSFAQASSDADVAVDSQCGISSGLDIAAKDRCLPDVATTKVLASGAAATNVSYEESISKLPNVPTTEEGERTLSANKISNDLLGRHQTASGLPTNATVPLEICLNESSRNASSECDSKRRNSLPQFISDSFTNVTIDHQNAILSRSDSIAKETCITNDASTAILRSNPTETYATLCPLVVNRNFTHPQSSNDRTSIHDNTTTSPLSSRVSNSNTVSQCADATVVRSEKQETEHYSPKFVNCRNCKGCRTKEDCGTCFNCVNMSGYDDYVRLISEYREGVKDKFYSAFRPVCVWRVCHKPVPRQFHRNGFTYTIVDADDCGKEKQFSSRDVKSAEIRRDDGDLGDRFDQKMRRPSLPCENHHRAMTGTAVDNFYGVGANEKNNVCMNASVQPFVQSASSSRTLDLEAIRLFFTTES